MVSAHKVFVLGGNIHKIEQVAQLVYGCELQFIKCDEFVVVQRLGDIHLQESILTYLEGEHSFKEELHNSGYLLCSWEIGKYSKLFDVALVHIQASLAFTFFFGGEVLRPKIIGGHLEELSLLFIQLQFLHVFYHLLWCHSEEEVGMQSCSVHQILGSQVE